MKHSLKNKFLLYKKTASSGKKNRKWFPLAGKYFSVNIDPPYFQSWFSTVEKKAPNKSILFLRDRK